MVWSAHITAKWNVLFFSCISNIGVAVIKLKRGGGFVPIAPAKQSGPPILSQAFTPLLLNGEPAFMRTIQDLDKNGLRELLKIYAKNWLAHDGCWFQGIEQKLGMTTAKEFNDGAWERFTGIEANRILKFLGRKPGEGLDSLEEALGFRLYASINRQEIVERTENRMVLHMCECRVQVARKRKGLPDYPCKSGGVIEYTGFAKAIDPRIQTRCIGCPPDDHPAEWWCAWEFTIKD